MLGGKGHRISANFSRRFAQVSHKLGVGDPGLQVL
ncbi:MAG: hypothetical protein RLZZ519_1448, partial [Bacteroidota bacterium]